MFMPSLIVTMVLRCGWPVFENTSKIDWNEHDLKTLNSAMSRCAHHYKDAPCVRHFHKTYPQGYRVICGKEPKHERL